MTTATPLRPEALEDFEDFDPDGFPGAVPLSRTLRDGDSGTDAACLHVDTLTGLATADLPKREYVLAPIMPEKSLVMIYAQRGGAKTLFATAIGMAVSTGGTFLRWKADRPRRVLLVDGEMPAELMQERIRTMIAGADKPVSDPDMFRILSMDRQALGQSVNLAKAEDQARIDALLDGVDLLILDNISTLVSGGRENDAESWDTMQPWLLQLRRRGVSVLLVAHAGRGENARGTSKREDVLDTVIQLRRPDDYDPVEGARCEVRLTKARGVFGDAAAPFEAKLETRDGADFWSATTVTDLNFEAVLDLSKSGKSVREIEADLGISKSRVSRIQSKLKEEGRL